MSERKYEARERTVNKMSQDGLAEESLRTGDYRPVSMRPGTDDALEDRRTKNRKNVSSINQQENGSPKGGINRDERSSEGKGNRKKAIQRDQAERFRKTEDEDAGRRKLPSQHQTTQKDSGEERNEEAEEKLISDHSARMSSMRGHSAALTDTSARTVAELRRDRNKKQIQKYAANANRKKRAAEDTVPDTSSLSERKEEIKSRQKKERYNQEQRKQKAGRLSFDDENANGVIVAGSGAGFGRKAIGTAAGAAAFAAHAKVNETEDDNAAVQAAHAAERLMEDSVRRTAGSSFRTGKTRDETIRGTAGNAGVHKLNFGEGPVETVNAAMAEAEKKTSARKFFQKQRYQRMYAAAKREEKTVEQAYRASQGFIAKAAAVVKETFRRNSKVFLGLGILGVLFFLMVSAVTSCTAVIHGTGSSVISTTYASTDAEIHNVENAYRSMETALNRQINSIRSRYPDYDEFRYQIDEISHNPYHLISYFTVKYGEFRLSQVRAELEEIFHQQYEISTQSDQITQTHTKTVRVGDSLGVVVTSGYCSCPICCGQWSGGPTASGVYPTANHTIAVDTNNPFVPMGTHVVMNGVEYVVEDTGAFARYGVQFDVYYDNHSTALAHGHQSWEAYLADSNGSNEVEVTTTETVNRLSVTLMNHNLDAILRSRMTPNEMKRYDIYNRTYGNRNYLFDLNTLPGYGAYENYTIPPEALSDERFARMIREAEKYLGYPYVWGGSSPYTSFDCSGFVSWVVNNCGNGWNYGRLSAEGLRRVCAYVYPADARPGDLIFFQGTYDTTGASHCAIYVGDGMMIHCGNPIQYTSINGAYWQNHFYQFGRLP